MSVEEIRKHVQIPAPAPVNPAAKPKALTPEELRGNLGYLLAKYGFDPMEELIKIYRGEQGPLTVEQRIKICSEINGYLLPKLKAVEMRGQVQHEIVVQVKTFDPVLAAKPAQVYQIKQNGEVEKTELIEAPKEEHAND